MKKLFLATIMIMVMSCRHDPESKLELTGGDDHYSVSHVTYKRHQYLLFGSGNHGWGTHDPDCNHPAHNP